jgi:GNAT superfamily N-acetyltransferase
MIFKNGDNKGVPKMSIMRLVDKVNLGLMYDIELPTINPELRKAVTRELFIEYYLNAPSLGFEVDDQCVGGVLLKDKCFHIAVLPAFHGKWALLYRDVLEWVFKQEYPAYGLVNANNQKSLRFCERSGWEKINIMHNPIYGDLHVFEMNKVFLEKFQSKKKIG